MHTYFRHLHMQVPSAGEPCGSDELFKLSDTDVARFEATAAAIERHLLDVEILHLRSRLAEFEANSRKASRMQLSPMGG